MGKLQIDTLQLRDMRKLVLMEQRKTPSVHWAHRKWQKNFEEIQGSAQVRPNGNREDLTSKVRPIIQKRPQIYEKLRKKQELPISSVIREEITISTVIKTTILLEMHQEIQ
jgi:hypothetical protein